jgi:hypothetical protein
MMSPSSDGSGSLAFTPAIAKATDAAMVAVRRNVFMTHLRLGWIV